MVRALPPIIGRFAGTINNTVSLLKVAGPVFAEVYPEAAADSEVDVKVAGELNCSLEAGCPSFTSTKTAGKGTSPVPVKEPAIVSEGLIAVWPFGTVHCAVS